MADMFYKMSGKFRGTVKSLIGTSFTNDEFEKGEEAFEALININSFRTAFNQRFGAFLNEAEFDLFEVDNVPRLWEIEACMKKIQLVKGMDITFQKDGKTHPKMLANFYTDAGFYRNLDLDEVKAARKNDAPENAANADNRRGQGGFRVDVANSKVYEGCPNHFDAYIKTMQVRNLVEHGEEYDDARFADGVVIDFDFETLVYAVKCLFRVFWHQCSKNHSVIMRFYEKELLSKRVDYVAYAKEQLKALNSFDQEFMQMEWHNDSNETFSYEFSSSVKFIGEAGMGKTTQMKKMYIQYLREVVNGREVLPVWINLYDMSRDGFSLEEKVKALLGDYGQYYDELLAKNKIALFLDGYNEILPGEDRENLKSSIAYDIDHMHSENPRVMIAMTDRTRNSNPPCLMRNVKVYTFDGLTPQEMLAYVELKAKKDKVADILEYFDSQEASWVTASKILPAKLDNLMDLICDGVLPVDEDDFYDHYYDFILFREANDKKERRIGDLKQLLYFLAEAMEGPESEKRRAEILSIWVREARYPMKDAGELFELATSFPILVPGRSDNLYKFAYKQYFYRAEEGQ